jgi:hypothetical protein
VEGALLAAEYDGAVNIAYHILAAEFPFLAWPVVKDIALLIINKFADALFIPLNRLVAFKIIDVQTKAEAAAYAEALPILKEAQDLMAQKPESKEAKDAHTKALEDARARLGRLIHWDGS